MSWWNRSSRRDSRLFRDARRAGGPTRGRRLLLEDLEGRTLLSTYTVSEFFSAGVPVVRERIDNVTTEFVNPGPTFVVNTQGGSNTVNILDTSAGIAVTVNGLGADTVNIGNAGSVQGILAPVNVQNPPNATTLNVDDSADTTARTATLNTFVSGGSNWGSITGLASAAINYKYADTGIVNVTTGSAADTVNVLATGVSTNLGTVNGHDTVNIGNAGHVDGLFGTLSIQNAHSTDTINVDDEFDGTARTATLSTFVSGGANWGSITGLAPAAIDYKYAGTGGVNVTTGGLATINVLATGVGTSLSSGFGSDTVNVGNAGSVQDILGALTIQNPEDFTAININDTADTTARTVTLKTITSGGSNWGSVTGLAPAAINYKYDDTLSISITTGTGNDTVNVLATGNNVLPGGLTTTLSTGGGRDTINVGNGGSVQGIVGTLSIQNPPNVDTVNINDSADTAARSVIFRTFVSGGFTWDAIDGLAPATIDYRDADTIAANVTTGTGNDTVNVRAIGVATTLSNGGGNDTVNVGNGGSLQGLLAPVTIQSPHGTDIVSISDTLDATARTVTLSTFSSGGANWGAITGLAPAAIDYKYAGTAAVNITTGTGNDTINVQATGVGTSLSSAGGHETVNVGNGGSVQGIQGALTVQNPPDFDTINVDDSADTAGRNVTLSTFISGGANWGTITGLAPAAINYKDADASTVNVTTGSGNDTVSVRATGTNTNLGSSGGRDTVNVGNAGTLQGILAALFIQNPHGSDTINVDDSTDPQSEGLALSTTSLNGANWGEIFGLSIGIIDYMYAGTSGVNITLGLANDLVNVFDTGVPTSLSSNLGGDTINIGDNGSVQSILGALTIQNPPSFDTINIDDSQDGVGRNATLSTFVSGGANWGSITGLAPAAINYKYADTSGVTVTTGFADDTVNVRGTGVPTTVSSLSGNDTVNVGNAGSVQGILGMLTIQNPGGFTATHVDDSADTTARGVTLNTFVSGGANWGTITGLAPAAINYKYADTSSVSVTTGSAADTVNVLATGRTTTLSTGGGHDTVNVGNAGSVQGILANLIIQNPHSTDAINVDDSADTVGRGVGLSNNGPDLGAINQLAPALIEYSDSGTSGVSITTGSGSDTVNVFQTGVATNLSSSGGADTVSVGNFGSVQGILGALTIQNPPGADALIVDDSIDTAARNVTLSTFVTGGSNWGTITGLAPAAINYKYADTGGVNITTGTASDTINVLATGVGTSLSSAGGRDTVNVGNAGSLQGIIGALFIQNPPSFTTININDSADTAARTARLDTVVLGGANWGSISGLAPASIDFKYADTSSPVNISTAVGRVSWVVSTSALATNTGVVVKANGAQIN
jgi:hypothetical protein